MKRYSISLYVELYLNTNYQKVPVIFFYNFTRTVLKIELNF